MTAATARTSAWQTPVILIILAGCTIGLLTAGPRSAAGQFLTPLSFAHGWGRDVFSLAIAIQNIIWGLGQPVAGAFADRFGVSRVLSAGALVYAAGLVAMAYADTPLGLHLSAGLLMGLGLSGSAFTLVVGALGKMVPEDWRSITFGAGTAAGSFGQFLFSPLARGLIDGFGWQAALLTFAALMLLVIPLSLVLANGAAAGAAPAASAPRQSLPQALAEAFGHRSYVLLVLGFFTCGFQLAFVTVHLPAYLVDRGLSADAGAWTIGVIGLFNIAGALTAGWLGNRMPKRYILVGIYALRAVSIVGLVMLPMSIGSALLYGVVTGFLWLSTVPPTSGLVAVMFGTRWLTTLFGFAFFSHQVGGFLGVWLGGFLYERTGSYDIVWWLGVFFGVASALINWPIVEKPVARAPLAQQAA
jgi:MFS family permease